MFIGIGGVEVSGLNWNVIGAIHTICIDIPVCTGGEGSREINHKESIAFPSEARGAEKSFQIRLGEGVER